MQSYVRIKSYPNKIVLYLNSEIAFSTLLDDIAAKFYNSSRFFGNAKMILTLSGRKLSEEEEHQILDVIKENSSLEILFLDNPVDADRTQNVIQEQIIFEPDNSTAEKQSKTQENVRFYKSSLSDGDVLESPCDLVILGNVSVGATIISKQSIFVYGGLYGEAYAGYESGEDYVITALDFKPSRITIGDLEYTPKKGTGWLNKKSFNPQIAYIRNDKIVTDQLTKELLDSLI